MEIRTGVRGDAEQIAALHAESWRTAYAGIMPGEFLSGPLDDERLAVWRGRLDEPPRGAGLFVAVDGAELLGFAYLLPRSDGRLLLDNLHARPGRTGGGIGTRLLRHARAWAAEVHPGRTVYLEVLRGNTRAVSFYERHGAVRTDERICVCEQGFELPELEYSFPAAPPLSIAVAQPRCTAHDVAANAVAHAEAVLAADARVVVFPEMSLTGYELDAEPIAPDDERLTPIIAACAETGTLALVGAPVPGPHIGILAVGEAGARVACGKVYLHGTEAARFVPGEPAVIEVDGWRLGLAVCRDTGIPEHAAKVAALGIDGYVAGVVHTDDEAGVHGERARRVAADHGVWVATAAFAGPTGGGFDRTSGRSGIWSADGELIAEASATPDEFARTVFLK